MDNAKWQQYLDGLAVAADARAEELGRQAAVKQPEWAVEALGAVPEGLSDRTE